LFVSARFPFIGQGVLLFASFPRQFFSARPLHLEQEGLAQIFWMRERSGRQDVPEIPSLLSKRFGIVFAQ
jgi:hypothetical protein